MILTVAEMEDLKANSKAKAAGTIIESHVDRGKGPVATVIIQNGTLKLMDNFVAGDVYGKVRIMENEFIKNLTKVGPSEAVVISGFESLPVVGDILRVVSDEKEAKDIISKSLKLKSVKKINQDFVNMAKSKENDDKKLINVVIKADVAGSLEALIPVILILGNSEVGVKIIKSGIGNISESDAQIAESTNAQILGFHVAVDKPAKKVIEQKKIQVNLYQVIYELIDDVKRKLSDLLDPEIIEKKTGKVKIAKIFKQSKDKKEFIVGCLVSDGKVENKGKVKIIRNNEEIGEGDITNLKKLEKDVTEAKKNEECGLNIKSDVELSENDILEAYKVEHKKREL